MEISATMHKNVDWVTADTLVKDVAQIMKTDDIGAIPVGKNDRLVGMITDRDLTLRVIAEGLDPARTRAEDVMTKGVIYCQTKQTVEDAIHLMDQKKVRRLPVLNDKKRLVGMLSLGDIAQATSRELTGELTRGVSGHHK